MQPPPRKVKESQQAKLGFSELLSRLQTKQQQNSELLEEIRSFGKQRAAIEREYGQALQRLAVQHQKRDWHRGSTDAISTGVFAVWRLVVDAAAHSAASRLAAAEEYQQLIGRASRSLRNTKDVRAKKVREAWQSERAQSKASIKRDGWRHGVVFQGLEQLQEVQGEVVDALRELHRVKKSYHQAARMAHGAREKAAEAQSRVKRSEHGIFHFKAGLQKLAAKLCTRMRECDERLTEVRNEYLLALAAVNAHHRHYLSQDLPHILEQMDGDVYEDLRSHFLLLCGAEMDACMAIHKQYSSIWESVSKVTRERNVAQFLQESAPFRKTPQFIFQPAPHDKVSSLQEVCPSKSEEERLLHQAKRWAAKVAKDYKMSWHGQRVLQILESRLKLLSGQTGVSMEQKIAEMQDTVRKAKLSRVKAEGRLALLSASVAGVELLIHDAMNQAEEELERERHLSEHRKSTEDFSDDEFDLTDFEDYDDSNREVFAEPVAASQLCVYPTTCKVIYSYQASQSDELSVMEGEDLQVVEDGDVEDWLKVCNTCGQVGYVPENYVQFLCTPKEGSTELDGPTCSTPPTGNEAGTSSRGQRVARALYSYQAQSAEELSFQQGALIQLISCQHGEVDDGFWEGELDGRTGVFPSLVVEIIHVEGEEPDQEVPLHRLPLTAQTMTSISHLNPGCSSEFSATASSGLEDKQQDFCTRTADKKRVTPGSSHDAPYQSRTRLRPCRPAPSPPTQTSSSQLEED